MATEDQPEGHHIALDDPASKLTLVQGPHGPVVASTGTALTVDIVRATIEAVRERR